MNDIRNLMDNLQTQMEYREFDASARAPTDSWPVLERLGRAAGAAETPAAPVQAEAAPARPRGGSLLGRYAASAAEAVEPEAPAAGLARQLPLAEVFARLERAGR